MCDLVLIGLSMVDIGFFQMLTHMSSECLWMEDVWTSEKSYLNHASL